MLDLDALSDLDRALSDLHGGAPVETVSFPSETAPMSAPINVKPSVCPHLARMGAQ